MSRIHPSDNPLVPNPDTVKAARALAELLPPDAPGARLSLLNQASGAAAELPPAVIAMLRQFLEQLGTGRSVSIIPADSELTPNEAADYLAVSRTFVLKLMDTGQIPFRRVGAHRRLRFADLREYEKGQRSRADAAMDEMAQINQKLGLYE
jgi:excisionase family DNA binding protein